MKLKTNRLIATVLAIVMLVGLLPLTAFAVDAATPAPEGYGVSIAPLDFGVKEPGYGWSIPYTYLSITNTGTKDITGFYLDFANSTILSADYQTSTSGYPSVTPIASGNTNNSGVQIRPTGNLPLGDYSGNLRVVLNTADGEFSVDVPVSFVVKDPDPITSNISLSSGGMAVPVAGGSTYRENTFSGDGLGTMYTISTDTCRWAYFDRFGGESDLGNLSDTDKTFAVSTQYYVKVRVDACVGYNFTGFTSEMITLDGASSMKINNNTSYIMAYFAFGEPTGAVAPLGYQSNYLNYGNRSIAAGVGGTAISSFSVTAGTYGGTAPYTYSKVSGPAWLSITEDGTISGTRPNDISRAADTLVIRVTDDDGATVDVNFPVGAVYVFTVIPSFNVTYENFDAPAENGSSYRPNNFAAGEHFSVDYGNSQWETLGAYYQTFKYLSANGAEDVFAGETVYYLTLIIDADAGYGFSKANMESYTFDNKTPVYCSVNMDGAGVTLTYKFPATSLAKQPTPTATFVASGYDRGRLDNVIAGQKYSIDGGNTWIPITSISQGIASGITTANGIKVYMPGVDEESMDSDVQTIAVTRFAVTGVSVIQPTTIGGNGSIVGMDATMHYSTDDGNNWLTGTSPVSVPAPETVLVRVKESGAVLQSENATFTINAFVAGKAATPTEVSFNATDDDAGVLTGVSAGLKYRRNAAIAETISSTDDVLLTSLNAGDVITVWRVGNGTTTVDSDPVTFTLSQAATPTGVLNVNPTTAENIDGRITGVDSTMEYKRAGDAAWTAITGTELTGLVPDTYYVRVKGSGTVLASDDIDVTVSAITQALQPRAMSFTATGSDSGTLAQSGAGTGPMLNGEVFYWYTSLDATRHEFTYADTAPTLTGLTGACTLYVVRKGVVGSTYDSIPREVTVGKEERTVTAEDVTLPATAAAQGRINHHNIIEVWNEDEERWMAPSEFCDGNIRFSVGDAVTVRYMATGNRLAGESFHFVAVVADKTAGITVSATLSESFKMNYYITLSEAEAAAAKMKFTFNGVSKTVTGEKQVETDEYKFVFAGIAPQQMGDTISAKLMFGELIVWEKSFTMKEYLTTLRSEMSTQYYHSEYTTFIAISELIDSVLTYGAAAQLYAGYKTEAPVANVATGLYEKTFPSGTDFSRTNGTYATFVSASMNYNSLSRLKIKFTAEDTEELVVKYRIDAGEEKVLPYVSDGAGNYVITTPGIAALDYSKVYTFTVYKGGVEDATLTYSVRSYTYSMRESTNANMRNLALAAYYYGSFARTWANILGA